MRLLLALATTLAVLLVACGGGGDNENEPAGTGTPSSPAGGSPTAEATSAASPAAAATVENRDEVEALLKAASLQLEDLPEGFALDEEMFTTNEEASVEAGGTAQPTLDDFTNWGRILGYDATYSDPEALSSILEGGTLSLSVTTTLYEDSDGAGQALDYVRDQAEDEEFIQSFEESFVSPGLEVGDASITPLSLSGLGDDRQAYEIKVTMRSIDLDQDFEFIAQLFGIRRDRLIGAVTLITINETPSEGQLEDLAGKLDDRMEAALE